MTEQPLISVIVPVYNAEAYVGRCIESLLGQTYTHLEILLVDDGSTDNSYAICQRYAATDSRLVLCQKENGGQATARNMALEIAKGEYIGFVDADDEIDADMYRELYAAISSHAVDIAVCGRYQVMENGKQQPLFVFDKIQQWENEESVSRFLIWDGVDGSPCDKLFARKLWDGVRFPAGYICEDLPVVFELLTRSRGTVHVGKPLYRYYQREGSTSHSAYSTRTQGLIRYHKHIYEQCLKRYPALKERAEFYYFCGVSSALITYRQSGADTDDAYMTAEVAQCARRVRGNRRISVKNRLLFTIFRRKALYALYAWIKRR